MGEIKISIPGEDLEFPYPVCKKSLYGIAFFSYLSYFFADRESVKTLPNII